MSPAPLYRNPFRRYSNVPLIGKWTGRVGRVVQIASHPCQVEPEIWVYALWNVAPLIMWSLLKPSPSDYLAERATMDQRKKRKQKFSIWAMTPGIGPPPGVLGWAVFKAGSFARMLGYYFTVADAITAGMVNWTSTAYRWNGCVVPGGAACNGHILEDSVQLFGPGRVKINTWISDLNQFMICGPDGIVVPSQQIASVGFSLTSKPFGHGLPDASYTLELVEENSGQVYATSWQKDGPNGTKVNGAYWANGMAITRAANKLKSGGKYVVYCDKTAGALQWASGTISGTSSPQSDAITPDP